METNHLLKALKTTMFLSQRFLETPMRHGIIPKVPLREFEGQCLLIAVMEEELVRLDGGTPAISLDERYHQTMLRCRDMDEDALQAESNRLAALLRAEEIEPSTPL